MRGHAVNDRAHRVLADAEVQIAPSITPAGDVRALSICIISGCRVEIPEPLELGVGGWVQVTRAASKGGHTVRDGVHHLSGSHTGRHPLGVGWKDRDVRV